MGDKVLGVPQEAVAQAGVGVASLLEFDHGSATRHAKTPREVCRQARAG